MKPDNAYALSSDCLYFLIRQNHTRFGHYHIELTLLKCPNILNIPT